MPAKSISTLTGFGFSSFFCSGGFGTGRNGDGVSLRNVMRYGFAPRGKPRSKCSASYTGSNSRYDRKYRYFPSGSNVGDTSSSTGCVTAWVLPVLTSQILICDVCWLIAQLYATQRPSGDHSNPPICAHSLLSSTRLLPVLRSTCTSSLR